MSQSQTLPLKRQQDENPTDDDSSAIKPTRLKISLSSEDSDKKVKTLILFSLFLLFFIIWFLIKIVFLVQIVIKRVKDVEICVPIVYGTIAFYLGRKASE